MNLYLCIKKTVSTRRSVLNHSRLFATSHICERQVSFLSLIRITEKDTS
ncbi:CLUMA_CG009178, isoform A [Clunio marinus]|uniref:CLUMA_CG009178, isoform A n=1 Tax=Clunio marinus TaxID=568069 RepID=A0A1J1IBA3_9DIPT|nr:CLUMA_CG009178, isoform A [Clunio marinus]